MRSEIDSAERRWMKTDLASTQGFSPRERTNSFVISPGGAIDVAAPGVGILSIALGGGTETNSGTSHATAHVSGLVALYIAANGRATNAEGVYLIRQAIVDSGLAQVHWKQDPFDLDDFPEPLAIASETWIPAPGIVVLSNTPSAFQFTFTIPGYSYVAQRIRSLAASNEWSVFASAKRDRKRAHGL
jgi:subtilisin family serine protease